MIELSCIPGGKPWNFSSKSVQIFCKVWLAIKVWKHVNHYNDHQCHQPIIISNIFLNFASINISGQDEEDLATQAYRIKIKMRTIYLVRNQQQFWPAKSNIHLINIEILLNNETGRLLLHLRQITSRWTKFPKKCRK